MKRRLSRLARLARSSALFAMGIVGGRAEAFDPGITHAAITERAASLSSLGRQLQARFGLAHGPYELLRLDVPGERGEALRARLARLDPTTGGAPSAGKLPALGWVVAGSILEEVPPERGRNHFFDPSTGAGLDQGGIGAGTAFRLAAAASGLGTVRGVFTGAAFDGTGMASTAWLTAPDNELGVGCFLEARLRAVSAPTAVARQSALAEALLCAGAILHVVEDAGEPAHVHNDFRVSLYDHGGPFSRYVLARYGRLSLPPPSGPSRRVAHLVDLISAADGTGLADTTARGFFSEGTLPSEPQPPGAVFAGHAGLPPLHAGSGRAGYLTDAQGRHLARWRRDGAGLVAWSLDERCLADAAATLVPATEQAAISALDHLFRGSLRFETGALHNGALGLGAGEVVVLTEDAEGKRSVVAEARTSGSSAGDALVEISDSLTGQPLIAYFRGVDTHGEPLIVSVDSRHAALEDPPPPKKIEPEIEERSEPERTTPPAAEPAPPAPAPVAPAPVVVEPPPHAAIKPAKKGPKHFVRRPFKKGGLKAKGKVKGKQKKR